MTRIKGYVWRRRWYAVRRFWYEHRYGVPMGWKGTMLPKVGKGKFVSLKRRGPFLDIISHDDNDDMIRLIPYQPNHGLMVEYWHDGTLRWRSHLDYRALRKMGLEREESPARGAGA